MTRDATPVPVPGVMEVPDYFQGASVTPDMADPVKLSSNENAYGPSPAAVAAIHEAASAVHLYPEGSAQQLTEAIAKYCGLASQDVLVSTGSDDLIPTLMRAFMQRDDEGLYFADSFPKYRTNLIGLGAKPVEIPRDKNRNYALCIDSVSRGLTARSKILIVDNPCNPTGAILNADELVRLHAALPGNVILALDEAYVEFSDIGDAGLQLAKAHHNVVVFRTFSKAFALAGLRIGWCTGAAPLLAAMQRLRPTFPLTGVSIHAAVAALQDRAHTEQSISRLRKTRSHAVSRLRDAGWAINEPHGNFILLRAVENSPMSIEAASRQLLEHEILVRQLKIQGDEPVLRVTVGTELQMDRVIDLLGQSGG